MNHLKWKIALLRSMSIRLLSVKIIKDSYNNKVLLHLEDGKNGVFFGLWRDLVVMDRSPSQFAA